MAKILNRALKLCGENRKIGTPYITVLEYDADGMVMRAKGATLPTATDAGYAVGCIFVLTSTGVAYQNTGDASSCEFSTGVAGGDITSVVAGDGLTGGGETGAVTLNVGAGTLVTVAANTVGVTPGSTDYGFIGSTTTPWTAGWLSISQLAGAGLTHTAGVLNVIAGTGITVNANDVQIKAGYTPTHIAKFAGTITWTGDGASLDTTITGVAATDFVSCTFRVAPTQAAYIKSAIPSTDHLIITLSAANSSNDAQIDYVVFRAVA